MSSFPHTNRLRSLAGIEDSLENLVFHLGRVLEPELESASSSESAAQPSEDQSSLAKLQRLRHSLAIIRASYLAHRPVYALDFADLRAGDRLVLGAAPLMNALATGFFLYYGAGVVIPYAFSAVAWGTLLCSFLYFRYRRRLRALRNKES